jgi:DNA-directed RNA polymerase specialized sigma24 family protein
VRAGRPTPPNETADAVALREAVVSFPSRQRAALVLRYYGGLSVAETAENLGCAEGTVKSLTSRAIDGLRDRLDIDVSDIREGRAADPEEAHHA